MRKNKPKHPFAWQMSISNEGAPPPRTPQEITMQVSPPEAQTSSKTPKGN